MDYCYYIKVPFIICLYYLRYFCVENQLERLIYKDNIYAICFTNAIPFQDDKLKTKGFYRNTRFLHVESIEETNDVQGRLDRMDFTLHSFLNRHLG